MRDVGGRGDDDLGAGDRPRRAVVVDADGDAVRPGDDGDDADRPMDAVAEARGECGGEAGRAADDAAGESPGAVSDEVEVADAVAGRELLGSPEERVRVQRKMASTSAGSRP